MSDSDFEKNKRNSRIETDADRLRGILNFNALSVGLVSAYAGDRSLTEEEGSFLSDLKEDRGQLFYSDLLYAVTHQYFPPIAAERLWKEILRHKYDVSGKLKRNIQIVVATLDYLTNFKNNIELPTLVNEEQIAEIVRMSMRDGLTGLFNHASFYEIINLELRLYARHGTVVSLIIADIDDFKTVNDTYGHQKGDCVLKELATAIENTIRDSDICCRYGGEEFAIILPLTNARGASEIAEKIRLEAMQVSVAGDSLTISLGVAACDEKTISAHALVEKADHALYRAKKNGKNQVVVI